MPAHGKTVSSLRVDWLISNLRWPLLIGVASLIFLDAIISDGCIPSVDALFLQVGLLVIASLYNLVVILLLSNHSPSRGLPALMLVLDSLLIMGFIITTGGMNSPLLFFALFPILTAALRFSKPTNLIIAPFVIASFAIPVYVVSPPGSWSDALSLIAFSLILMLASPVASLMSAEVKRAASCSHQAEIDDGQRKLRTAREHSRLTFELASTLSATLDYSTILQAVLEVGEKGMQELGRERANQVGIVLLFAQNGLHVAVSRDLPARDSNLVLQGREGALAKALATGEPVVVEDPGSDSELGRIAGIHSCQQAVVVPLRAGLESFGAVIFGNGEADIYSEDLVNLLTAVCNQAIVALRNAQLYEDLREEKERIVTVEEDARKKLARNLHDGPTQNMASLALQVSFVRKLMVDGTSRVQISRQLRAIEDLARRTTKQIRHMLFTLRPLVLETRGLTAALRQYAKKLEATEGPAILVEAKPGTEELLEREAQGVVFYIIEEAMSNARKHARADYIHVRIGLQGNETFVAEVEDDGKGFDLDAVQMTYDRQGSLGLINMQERAEMIQGELTITTEPGQGTRVTLTVPAAEGE